MQWRDYCAAMVSLDEADIYEAQGYLKESEEENRSALSCILYAKELFAILETVEFEDAKDMHVYCEAREYELLPLNQKAEDLFSTIPYTRDAKARLARINSGEPLPTQTPVHREAALLNTVRAEVSKQVTVYLGPGKDYEKLAGVLINAESTLYICGSYEDKTSSWYLMETETDQGRVRFWCARNGYVYPLEDGTVQPVMKNGKNAYINTASEVLEGPGEGYRSTEIHLERNTKVKCYHTEGAYTMIEILHPLTGKKLCGWVLTNHLN